MKRLIKKEILLGWIDSLFLKFEVIGTKELPNRGIFYQTLENSKDLYIGQGFAIEPIKKFFSEPSSWILRHKEDNDLKVEDFSKSDKKRIIIGARPCETRGLTLLDKVFESDYEDIFYIENRKRTIIVGQACSKPDKNCFCTSMGGSPVNNIGMDLIIFEIEQRKENREQRAEEIEDRFMIEVITDRGREIFGSLGEELNENYKKSLELEIEKRKELVKKNIKIPENLDKIFDCNYWDEVSKPCICCGVCTYLCPTCHCFDLVDEGRKRLRCYDGCSFSEFTLQTSGENPRPTKKERYRQRVFHKFDYFRKNFGEHLCIGCGRCIRYCPVKINISDIVAKAPI